MSIPVSHSRFALVAALTGTVFWSACADQPLDVNAPESSDAVRLTAAISTQELIPVMDVQERHTEALLSTTGIVGTAVGVDQQGRPAVKVLAMDHHGDVPEMLEGFPVEVVVTGEIFAHQVPQAPPCGTPPCGGGNNGGDEDVDLTARFDRPVPIGVSTGHPSITAGTLGARVKNGNTVFALSNNHVYAASNAASTGDAVIQPGTFDGGSSPADDIGTLDDFQPIVFSGCPNTMDAAIALTTTNDVGNSTPDGVGYGTPRSTTIAPALQMKVMKVGRTTGLTKGTITAINATVNVNYGLEGIACFTGQIVTTNISAGGDSGSLVVVEGKGRNKNDNRKPVGLLYAGSSSITILSPIDLVLDRFDVTIDGN